MGTDLMPSYPVAYKEGARRYAAPTASRDVPGFQRNIRAVVDAANDNLPFPANDDGLDLFTDEQRRKLAARRLQGEIAAEMAARRAVAASASSLISGVGWALTAYEFGHYAGVAGAKLLQRRVERIQRIPRPSFPQPDPVGAGWYWQGYPVIPEPSPPNFHVLWVPGIPTTVAYDYSLDWVLSTMQPMQYTDTTMTRVTGQTDVDGRVMHGPYMTVERPSPSPEHDPFYTFERVVQTVNVRVPLPAMATNYASSTLAEIRATNRVSVEPSPERAIQDHVRPNEIAITNRGPAPAHHVSRPRRSNEKEKKTTARSVRAYRIVTAALGLTTESLDLISAVWDALPPQYKSGYYRLHKRGGQTFYVKRWHAKPQQMLDDIWQHFEHVDAVEAVDNIAKNQIEDFVIGKASSKTDRAVSDSGMLGTRPFGLGIGPAL